MRFVDEARIKVKAGDGGPGIVAWRREKFVPMGGPAGGDGGKGGDVIFIAKEGRRSLLDLKQQALIAAEDGLKGQPKNKTGKKGRDRIIFVPIGTEIEDMTSLQRFKADLLDHDQMVIVCRGGDGGFGNSHFKSQRCNAPERSSTGFKGEARELKLTLKLMADVGLLGYPNAGKSTLLSRLSNAKPKISDYPFTTINPMVGVCELELGKTMVVADIPGLIEGASKGVGLGFRFLRHLERVRILCHVIDGSDENDLMERMLTINRELSLYSDHLAGLPQIIAINKIDVLPEGQLLKIDHFIAELKQQGINVFKISAVTSEGLAILKEKLFQIVTLSINETETLAKESVFDPTKNLY